MKKQHLMWLKTGFMRALCVFIIGAYVCLNDVDAAVDRLIAADLKRHQYVENGLIVGGESGKTFTLLDVRRILSPKDKIERIFFDLGDEHGKPLKNRVSYFQVSVEKENSRIVIDLSQMLASGIDAAKLKKIFQQSPYVKQAKINYDPIDASISIQLWTKKRVQIEAFKLPASDKASRIVVDLKEQG